MPYQVQLDVYAGPLDLLLYLVRRQELDILHLPIARITREFLTFLEVLQELDLDEIGEFVVMASALLEIKSRLALPNPEDDAPVEQPLEESAADPRSDLVRQLLEYKRFKDASRLLEEQSSEWRLRFPRLSDDSPTDTIDPSQDRIREVELWDLVSALSRVLHQNTESAPKSIVYDDTPISTYVEQIRARVLTETRVAFTSLFDQASFKSKIIGIFLAILELLRHYQFRAEQAEDYGEIWVLPPGSQPALLAVDEQGQNQPESVPARDEAAKAQAGEAAGEPPPVNEVPAAEPEAPLPAVDGQPGIEAHRDDAIGRDVNRHDA